MISTSPSLIDHPCMNDQIHHCIARIHLPVAHRCNIRCFYCERRVGILPAEKGRPGTCERIMEPSETIDQVLGFLDTWGHRSIVGIAGPGDPLANNETFETMALIRRRVPNARLCMCTNGLNLPDSMEKLKQLGLSFLSVTINAVEPLIGAKIHEWVDNGSDRLHGEDAAALLMDRQLTGIEMAVQSGMMVKVNSVVIPDINHDHIPEVARTVARLGAKVFNPMPLIPSGAFADRNAPAMPMMKTIHSKCSPYLSVFKSCKQCRADARGIPGKDPYKWKRTG